MHRNVAESVPGVQHFRQILLWPLELMTTSGTGPFQTHSQLLGPAGASSPWREVEDEFTGDPELFQERHYSEFVTFLPYVQRFLYGEGRGPGVSTGQSPIRVFRRADVARARLTFPGEDEPLVLDVVHVDLYFFYDIDVVILVVELAHFRHQHFLLFLIAHFHKAALVMLSDRLVDALNRLDIQDAEFDQTVQAHHPPVEGDLPALHAPLLVP